MNGFEVCRTLRAEGNWTPILVLTAKDGEYDEAEALDTGADDFLSKPFSFVVLVARLRALLRRGATPRPPVLRGRRPGARPGTRAVPPRRRRGRASPPREFGAAGAPAAPARARSSSKSEILDEVWGPDFPATQHRGGVRGLPAPQDRRALRRRRRSRPCAASATGWWPMRDALARPPRPAGARSAVRDHRAWPCVLVGAAPRWRRVVAGGRGAAHRLEGQIVAEAPRPPALVAAVALAPSAPASSRRRPG